MCSRAYAFERDQSIFNGFFTAVHCHNNRFKQQQKKLIISWALSSKSPVCMLWKDAVTGGY